MEELWMPEKHNIMFEDIEKVTIILSYNWSSENKPSSMFIYWGNERYREAIWNFHSNTFGKDKVEKYWKEVLELDKNKKLTLDSLCDTIENTFISKEKLKLLKKN
jgi:hypothetical protein